MTAEVDSAALVLNTPAARLIASGEERPLLLEEVEALLASDALVVDACRHVVRHAGKVGLARNASGVVCARPRTGRSVAGRRIEGHRCLRAHSERGSPMNHIVRDCESRSGGSARRFDRWPA